MARLFRLCTLAGALAAVSCGRSVDSGQPTGSSSAAPSASAVQQASDGKAKGSTTENVDEACGSFAEVACGKLESCSPHTLGMVYGEKALCAKRMVQLCKIAVAAPGSNTKTAMFKKCRDTAAALSCQDLLATGLLPKECLPEPGDFEEGKACGNDTQCKSAYCKKPAISDCGVCASKSGENGACKVPTDCQYGLVCNGTKCVTPGNEGAKCSAEQPCWLTLSCKGGSCAKPLDEGAACKADDECDRGKGLFCDPVKHKCAATKVAKAGEPCGAQKDTFVVCGGGANCTMGAGQTGTCQSAAADGAACDTTKGASCSFPARCVNNICVLQEPAACK